MVNLNYHGWVKTIRTIADQNGLGLVFEANNQPRTDSRNIYVQRPDAAWTDAQFLEWEYTIHHEIGHNIKWSRPAFDVLKKYKLDSGTLAHTMYNLVTDTAQEQVMIDEGLEGRNHTLFEGGYAWKSKQTDRLGKAEGVKLREAAETFSTWDLLLRDKNYHLDVVYDTFKDKLTPQSIEWLEQIESGPYKKIYDALDFYTDKEAWEKLYLLTKKINEEVFKIPNEESGHKDGTEPDDNTGDKEQSGKGKAEKNKGKGKGKGKDEEGEESKRDKEATVNYEDLIFHKHDENKNNMSYASMTINYDGAREDNSYIPGTVKVNPPVSAVAPHYRAAFSEITSHNLASTLRKLLLVKAKSLHEYGKKKGRLHYKNVYRATMKDAGVIQEKIFKKKVINNTLKHAVYILADFSGSMGGNKVVTASHALVLLNEALGTLRIPFEISTFSYDSAPIHFIIKDFNESVTTDKMIDRLVIASNKMLDNGDGESILWAYSKLRKRREPKKSLIVLSDGQPACYQHSIETFTKQVIKEIEKDASVDIYGIGILDRTVKRFYKNHTVINNISELESGIVDVIKNKFI